MTATTRGLRLLVGLAAAPVRTLGAGLLPRPRRTGAAGTEPIGAADPTIDTTQTDTREVQDMTESTTEQQPADARPVLKVIEPDATPEEVAAIVAVFSALGSSAPAAPRRRSQWAAPRPRAQLHAGPGAWRASGLPR